MPRRELISTIVNGKTMQQWNTNDMVFNVKALVSFLSQRTTLPFGTVIVFSGTPHGIGMSKNLREGWVAAMQ